MSGQKEKEQKVIAGGLISFLLLIIFITLEFFDFKGLELDLKWIAVCGIPILVAVFTSGFIKVFKGFGVELEANLKEEPINLEMVLPMETIGVHGFQKSSLNFLYNLPENEKRKTKKLTFVKGRRNYYETWAVEEYFRLLENLEFIEITSADGVFECLIKAKNFLIREGGSRVPNIEKIESLINAVEQGETLFQFPETITEKINESDSIIDAYKKMEATSQGKLISKGEQILPVVNKAGRMVGLIQRRTLEKTISKKVLSEIQKLG